MPESTPPLGAVARRKAAAAARSSEPQSWGESLQRYHASRTTVSNPALLSPSRPSKHGVFNEQIKPVEFHPLRQVYADSKREKEVRQREEENVKKHIEVAQYKVDHLANHKGYDMLTGQLQPTTNTAVAQALAYAETKHRTKVTTGSDGKRSISFTQAPNHPPVRDYNILTNHLAFEGSGERLAKLEAKAPPLHNRSKKEAREYNILTNRYQFENHEARAERETRANDTRLREKYFAASHYNPVTLQFVHPQEESRYQHARAVAMASHGQGQLANLPPRMKRSEGQCYDILAPGVVKDQAQLQETYDKPAERQRATRQTKHQVERNISTRDLALDQTSVTRSSNRVSNMRYDPQLSRGYDVISNQPYDEHARQVLSKPSVAGSSGSNGAKPSGGGGTEVRAAGISVQYNKQ